MRATDGGQIRSECEVEVRLVLNSPEEARPASSSASPRAPRSRCSSSTTRGPCPSGDFEIICKLGYLPLPKGHYSLWTAITGFPKGKRDPYLPWQPLVSFEAFGPDRMEPPEGVMA